MKNIVANVSIALTLALNLVAQTDSPKHSVADINGRATQLEKPAFPAAVALANDADGEGLILKVIVDESGNVISAQCSTNCHPALKDAAELAASTSKFKPLIVDGKAVKYEGHLIYTFVVERINWARFGGSLESTRQFDNLSLGPVAQILSAAYGEEKAKLLSLDLKDVDFDARQKGINEVAASIRSKIKGDDLWRFETSMALRRITFWTMASGMTDRAELKIAIDELPKFITNAPKSLGSETVNALVVLSKFRVNAEMSESELRKNISIMTRGIRLDQ